MTAGASSRVVVQVPKNLQGKLIGRRGATLADIESDYPGVRLHVPKRNDPSTDVVITGPPSAVKHAHARVLDICDMGFSSSSSSSAARKHANDLYDEASRLFEAAKAVDGDRARRDALWERAKRKKEEAHAAQMAAAREIFRAKNGGYGDDQMDLHGLYVKEAVHFVEQRLKDVDAQLRSGALPDLTIITGAGNHSVGNKAKIKPAIRQLLEKEGYPYTEEGSGGILLVSFGTEGAPPTHTIPPKKPEEPKPQDDTGSGLLFAVLSSAAKFFFGLLCGGSSARAPEHNERNAPTDAPQQRENGQRSAPQSGQQDAGQSMAKS